jgi:predicted dehydrogenase
MANSVYGVGIMGAGNISAAYLLLAPLFRNLEVRGIADIAPEAARKRATEYGVAAMTPDELLKNSEIDVVVNLTIPATHFSVSMDALSAGKHVYSEKPFVLTLEEGERLKGAAESRGLMVGSAPDTYLGGSHQQVRHMIDSGQLGRIHSGTTHVMGRGMEHWHPNPTFFFKPGAGPILDMGPYYVAELIHLLGPVRRVTAFSGMARTERVVTTAGSPILGQAVKVETPTTIHAILEFHNGAIVTLGASWDVYAHGHHNVELYGTEGAVFVPDPNFFAGTIEVAGPDGKRSAVAPWEHPLGVPNSILGQEGLANYRAAGLSDLMDAAGSGRRARCGIDVALHTIDVLTAILRAGESGEVITLTTTCERPAALGPDEARALLR